VFISFAALVFFMYNYDIREYAGPNPGTVFLSTEYLLLFMLVMSPFSAGLEQRIFSVMAEDRDEDGPSVQNISGIQRLKSAGTYIVLILFLIAVFLFIVHTSMKNDTAIPAPFFQAVQYTVMSCRS